MAGATSATTRTTISQPGIPPPPPSSACADAGESGAEAGSAVGGPAVLGAPVCFRPGFAAEGAEPRPPGFVAPAAAETDAGAGAALLGTAARGKAAPFVARRAWPVTHTGVWSLEAE